MLHRHKWKEIARTYRGSYKQLEIYETSVSYGKEWVKYPEKTTILWECEDKSCQKLRKEELEGKII